MRLTIIFTFLLFVKLSVSQVLFYNNSNILILNQTKLTTCMDVSSYSTAIIHFVGNSLQLYDDKACSGNSLVYVENNFIAGYASVNSWVHTVNSMEFIPYFTSMF